MALDTQQKRGSVIDYGLPFATWLSEPSGTVDAAARASLLQLAASTGSSIVSLEDADVPEFDVFTDAVGDGEDLEALVLSAEASPWDWSGLGWQWNDVSPPGVYNTCQNHCALLNDRWAIGGNCATDMADGDGVYFRDSAGNAVLAVIESTHVVAANLEMIRFTDVVDPAVARMPICVELGSLLGNRVWSLTSSGTVQVPTLDAVAANVTHSSPLVPAGGDGFPGLAPLSDGQLALLWVHSGGSGGPSLEYNLAAIQATMDFGEAFNIYTPSESAYSEYSGDPGAGVASANYYHLLLG